MHMGLDWFFWWLFIVNNFPLFICIALLIGIFWKIGSGL